MSEPAITVDGNISHTDKKDVLDKYLQEIHE